MFGKRASPQLDVEITARGLVVAWECAPGIVVRRAFPSASTGCAAVEALRDASPRTLEETILILDRVARARVAPHPAATLGPSSRLKRPNLRHRP